MTALTFSANGERFLGSWKTGVRVWRVEDCKEMAFMQVEDTRLLCLAASKDGRWIAAGTARGELLMWNAETYEQVLVTEYKRNSHAIAAIDFSPDSSRLVSASVDSATVWDVTSGKQLQTLSTRCQGYIAAKYSPQGGRIATATLNSVPVFDSKDGRLLVDIKVQVTSSRNNSLFWFGNHIFVISNCTIKQYDASIGSTVAEWRVPYNADSCITLPQHGTFVAYSARHTVMLWNTSTHNQSRLAHPQEISSLAFSPDGRFLAIATLDGGVIVQDLKASLPSYHSVMHTPAKGSLIRVLIKRSNAYVASGLWEPALNDANKVIELDPSSPWGYERKHAALHKAGDYENATHAFEEMLSKMSQSSDPEIHKLRYQHIARHHEPYLDASTSLHMTGRIYSDDFLLTPQLSPPQFVSPRQLRCAFIS
ncbi:WD40-repeat-containing domain protein [Boletus edulis]|nr:WD40-repeat-containing domain protein [Boletus edulis]